MKTQPMAAILSCPDDARSPASGVRLPVGLEQFRAAHVTNGDGATVTSRSRRSILTPSDPAAPDDCTLTVWILAGLPGEPNRDRARATEQSSRRLSANLDRPRRGRGVWGWVHRWGGHIQ